MNEIKTQLKTRHNFFDYLYWNLVLSVPVITACIAIYRASVMWLIFYIILCAALAALIYRFFCTHCPHYIEAERIVRCMFFWGVPKFFNSRPGPLNLFEKAVSVAAPAITFLLPLNWLRLQVDLLVIYILSLAVLGLTMKRNECGRCVYFHCPVNRAPEHLKDKNR